MNLYLIWQDETKHNYDTFDRAVVAADDEETARNINPNGGVMDWLDSRVRDWCKSPTQVKVKLIGKAIDGTKIGVVLASFNAG